MIKAVTSGSKSRISLRSCGLPAEFDANWRADRSQWRVAPGCDVRCYRRVVRADDDVPAAVSPWTHRMQGLEPFSPRKDKVNGWERCSAPDGRAKSEHALLFGAACRWRQLEDQPWRTSLKSQRPLLPHTTRRTGTSLETCWLPTPCMTKRQRIVACRARVRSSKPSRAGPRPSRNFKGTLIREFASNDTAILELVWKGVHTGPLQTPTGAIPASNKPIEVPACEVFRVEGGKVRGTTHYFDMLTLLNQIGVTGAAAPAKSAA